MLLEQVLAQWWHPVASSEALNHLYWAMRAVSSAALQLPSKRPAKWVYCLIVVLLIVALADAGAIRSE
jgi:hypothetical protein